MCKPSPPAAPDPQQTAAAQTQSNIATSTNNAALNRINQYTPYGSSVYSVDGTTSGGVPQYSQTTTLSPTEQNLFNMGQQGQQTLGQTALGQLGNLQSAYSAPFSFGGPSVTGSVANPSQGMTSSVNNSGPAIQGQVGGKDYSAAMKQAQDAAYKTQTDYLDPQYKNYQSDLDAKLAGQGLQVGDEAYSRGQNDLGMQRNQAYQGAQNAAVAAGNQEQNTLYGQDLASGSFQNAANAQGYNQGLTSAQLGNSVNNQQFGQNLSSANLNNAASAQGLSQQFALYNQPLNSYNALATGAQVQNPTFNSVPTANQANTDVAGITNSAYQNQLARYQQQQSGINNLFSLGGSLGSAAILS